MRRKDREVTDYNEILDIMKKCDICRVAFHAEEYPYIIPLNFGFTYRDNYLKLYFHGAKTGTKVDLIRLNPKVAFEMDCSHKLILGETACETTMEYESVCGNGSIRILEEDEKIAALIILMNQYQNDKKHEFKPNELRMVEVFELNVNEIYGKRLKLDK